MNLQIMIIMINLLEEQKHTCCKVLEDIDLVVCYELILHIKSNIGDNDYQSI